MDPNLRTLSLSAWMSLPGLDFGTWESAQHKQVPVVDRAVAVGIAGAASKTLRPKLECRKCIELRERRHHHQHHQTQYQKFGLFPPLLRPRDAELLQCNQCNRDDTAAVEKCKEQEKYYSNSTTKANVSPPITVLQLPKRNLSFQRQVSKEVQTRALVSRVAEYYESYVREMNLSQYFVDNTVVTAIYPLHCPGNPCPNTRWIVYG